MIVYPLPMNKDHILCLFCAIFPKDFFNYIQIFDNDKIKYIIRI